MYIWFGPGQVDAIEVLLSDKDLKAQKAAVEGLEELKLLLKYCQLYGISDRVRAEWLLLLEILKHHRY